MLCNYLKKKYFNRNFVHYAITFNTGEPYRISRKRGHTLLPKHLMHQNSPYNVNIAGARILLLLPRVSPFLSASCRNRIISHGYLILILLLLFFPFFFLFSTAIPPDYTCVVKNFYTEPTSPYTTSVYAIAGKNTFNANEFDFEIDPKLKSDSKTVSHSYGKELILPGSSCSRYNKQDTCRFSGIVSCLFYGNDFVVPETIPSFVATKSSKYTYYLPFILICMISKLTAILLHTI